MIIGAVRKQPAEIFPVTVDFVNELSVGETITGQTVTARNADSGADTSGTLLQGSPLVTGTKVAQTIKAGLSGEHHIVQYRITTSASNTFETEVSVAVQED